MNPFNIAIYVSLFLAIAVIVGGIWLLAKGIIKLSEAGRSGEGLSVELFNKIKVNTGYPALGFFVLGIVLIVLSIVFSKPSGLVPVNVVGKLEVRGDPSDVTLTVEPDPDNVLTTKPDFNGTVNKTLWARPEVARLRVVINASGYQPELTHWTCPIDPKNRQSALPSPSDLRFTKAPSPTPQPSEKIIPLPANVNPPPVQEAKGFKSP